VFSAPGLLFFVLGLAALTAPYMTLAANRIVAGDGFRVWQLAAPGNSVLALLLLVAGLVMGVLGAWPYLRVAGAALGLAALVWLLTLGGT
jgi:osmoprotectant transport system permease protein